MAPFVAYSWLVHLGFNDLGDIDIKTADPKGEDALLSCCYHSNNANFVCVPATIFERRGCRYII
jgi:hypothetical protein